MFLYLKSGPTSAHRRIVLCTGAEDERSEAPERALVFRCMEGNVAKVMVEFLTRDALCLATAVRLTTRRAKGCLGLINTGEGAWIFLLSLNECVN